MKKAVIVTPFDNYSYEVRIKYVEKYLKNQEYECVVISSDFDHRNKIEYKEYRSNLELLHVPKYKKNISFTRIYSHYCFAKKVYSRLMEINPDLIYGSIPPNFLVKFISKYKKENPDTQLIYEVGDLWPETLPIPNKIKKLINPVLSQWSGLRNKNLNIADAVIYECDLFKRHLDKYCSKGLTEIIYLCREDYYFNKKIEKNISDVITFAYIGSINNIIDIDVIVELLNQVKIKRKVLFKIIGTGENKDKLIALCIKNDIPIVDYGIVYDDREKSNILNDCQFAFNIMKDTVVVGATMKSLEYFHWGLILINNIPADTAELVDKYKCGYNITTPKETAEMIIKNFDESCLETMRNSRSVYCKYFSEDVIEKKFNEIFKRLEIKT